MKDITELVYNVHHSYEVIKDIADGLRFYNVDSLKEYNTAKGHSQRFGNTLDACEVYLIDDVSISMIKINDEPYFYKIGNQQFGMQYIINDKSDYTKALLPLNLKQGIYYKKLEEYSIDNKCQIKKIELLYHRQNNLEFIRTLLFP